MERNTGKNTKWHIARRLYWLRISQCLFSALNFVTSLSLLVYIGATTTLGIDGGLIVLQIAAALTLFTTLSGNCCGHRFSGYYKRGCLSFFIFLDLFCIALQVSAIIVLAVAGLPWNCGGLTSEELPGEPKSGSVIIGFGNGDVRGHLDRYCGIPKSAFWITIILLVLYLYAIGLLIQQMVEMSRRAKGSKSQVELIETTEPPRPHLVDTVVPSYEDSNHSAAAQTPSRAPPDETETRDPPPYTPGGAEVMLSLGKH